MRHDLATMKPGLKALEAKVAQDRRILTEAQLAALERRTAIRENICRQRGVGEEKQIA